MSCVAVPKRMNFADRNHGRQLELTTGSNKFERGPVSKAGDLEVLLEALLCDVDGA